MKYVIEISKEDIANLSDNDILVFDESKKNFYRMTPQIFFQRYEEKLNSLLKRYDKLYKDLIEKFENQSKEFNSLKKIVKENNEYTINLVKGLKE